MGKRKEAERFGVSFEPDLLKSFDREIALAGYECRSEALRDLARQWLSSRQLKQGKGPAFGVLAIVFNHQRREVSKRLTRLGHKFFTDVVTTVHIHLDEHNCLEALILRGKAQEIQRLADQMRALKGVEQGGLILLGLTEKKEAK